MNDLISAGSSKNNNINSLVITLQVKITSFLGDIISWSDGSRIDLNATNNEQYGDDATKKD